MKLNEILDTLKDQGLAKNRPDADFNPIELEIGISVEKEHVDAIEGRKEISKDHLTENPYYYTKVLAAAEDEMLINSVSVLCPFGQEDKQALLEAPSLSTRRETLITLMEFALRGGNDEEMM